MPYKTAGTIATINWKKSSGKGTLSFTIDPATPYLFEEKIGDKVIKNLLLAEDKDSFHKRDAKTTVFISAFGNPSASFAALLLLKQNRTVVEIISDDCFQVQDLVIKS